MRFSGWAGATLAALAWGCTSPSIDDPDPTEDPPPFERFELATLKAQRAGSGVGFLEFLTEPSLRMGLYHLGAGAVDGQGAHGQDEVYWIANGRGMLQAGGEDYEAGPGSIFFVKAGVDHRFHSITEELDVLVVFATRTSSPGDPDVLAFTAAETVAQRDAGQNVWDPFLQVSTMTQGNYMLPAALGGDGVLTHGFDEINIVTAGSGRFAVGDEAMDVDAGAIVFVDAGAGHRFRDLTDDLDVLILWERR